MAKDEYVHTDGQEQDCKGDVHFSENTMKRVHKALLLSGISNEFQRTDIITSMQHYGILFRERGKE